jgi:TIR domain
MTHDVFICHSSHDRDVADAACIALEQRGLRCWIAPRDLDPERNYHEGVAEAIAAGRIFLLIFSGAAGSAQLRGEAGQAAAQGLPLVVFRVADAEPGPDLEPLLRSAQSVDALTPPIAPHLDYLGDTVAQLLDFVRRGPLPATAPPGPSPGGRTPNWLPIALAGAAGMVAIALAAAYVGSRS